MATPYFQFKQFCIWHHKCAMKVGTDGVLLGSWANTTNCRTILDIGCGSGLISLMLAQRSNAHIDAIDIDHGAFCQTTENIELSDFREQVCAHHIPLEAYALDCQIKYDLIVSNPPYFEDSLKGPDKQRNTARHTDSLTLDNLLSDCFRLLNKEGRLALILPYDQKDLLQGKINQHRLFAQRITSVIPTVGGKPKRLLIEIGKTEPATIDTNELAIEIARHQYTEDYINLTRDFYLKM